MKDVVFGSVLLILAAAVVLLFAMLGELASRLPTEQTAERSQDVWPLEGVTLGISPREWPAALATFISGPDPRFVVVLSTACQVCDGVADQIAAEPDGGVAVVVSCPNPDKGEAFVQKHHLATVPHLIDERGSWVMSEFAVDTSPSAMTFRGGRLESVQVFQDLNALRNAAEPKGVA